MHGFLYWSAYNNICETLHMDAAPGRLMNGDANACGNGLAAASRDADATPELFMEAARQFLATAGARTCTVECHDPAYQEFDLGFETKRHGDFLYVTRAGRDERLKPGMRIAAVGKNTVPFLLKDTAQEIFGGRGTDREDWGLALRMFDDIDVFPGDGHVERLELRRFAAEPGKEGAEAGPSAAAGEAAAGVALLEVRSLADPEGLARALAQGRGALEGASGLVVDLRRCEGEADPESLLLLLPYLVDEATPAQAAFPGERLYTIYSKNNAERLLARLEKAREALERRGDDAGARSLEDMEGDVRDKAARVLAAKREVRTLPERRAVSEVPEDVPSPFGPEAVAAPAERAPERAVLLLDTSTGVGAERLALAARRLGKARTAGRQTPGAADYANYLTVEYPDIMASMTYPISRTEANRDGEGTARSGVPLDVHVPWTPEECSRDVMMERAVEAARG